jgi:hypothetical protein
MYLFFVRLWYRFTMAWTRWRKPADGVRTADSIAEIPPRMRNGNSYRPDPRGFDYLAHPRCFQARLNRGENTYDCEDHGTYWAVVLLRSGLASKAGIGFVYWKDQDDKRQGHAVVVFEDRNGTTFWADYGAPHRMDVGSPWWAFGADVLHLYNGKELVKVSYLEITGVKADDTPVFKGEHRTRGRWFRSTNWTLQ